MESSTKKVAVIGAGPAGCTCAYFASINNAVTLFDEKPMHTILATGGGRCNLAYQEYDFKELAKFYPRGEKFLYSVFSQFATGDTIDFFNKIGIETYVQEDDRFFPISDSAREVKEKMLNSLMSCAFKREKVLAVTKLAEKFKVKTANKIYEFDEVVIAVGGHSGFDLARNLGHKIIEPKPALTGLSTAEDFSQLQGVSLKNARAEIYFDNKKIKADLCDDLLFTKHGMTGPLAYKISSICARLDYNRQNPLVLNLDLINSELDFQDLLNSNPKKDIKNLVADFVPKSFAESILKVNKINPEMKCCEINAKVRDLIVKNLLQFEVHVVSPAKEGEIVTSGGVCLDEINPKTMKSKLVEGLYFCGEVIDVDGFCGGFNLQNCWSTGYIAGKNTNGIHAKSENIKL